MLLLSRRLAPAEGVAVSLRQWVASTPSTSDSGHLRDLGGLLERVSLATGIQAESPASVATRSHVTTARPSEHVGFSSVVVGREVRVLADLLDHYSGEVHLGPHRSRKIRRTSIASQLAVLRHLVGGPDGDTTGSRSQVGAPVSTPSWAPYGNEENQHFSTVSGATPCVFARKSVSWAFDHMVDPADPGQVKRLGARLRGFTRAAQREPLDCFVATFAPEHGADIARLAALTNRVLRSLTRCDGLPRPFGHPERPGWQFVFHGEPYFVLALGECYPPTHARHLFGVQRTVLIFQPDSAFERVVNASGDGLISPAVRHAIRDRYARADMPYDLAHTESPVEAHRFVKPIEHGAPPVPWWTSIGQQVASS